MKLDEQAAFCTFFGRDLRRSPSNTDTRSTAPIPRTVRIDFGVAAFKNQTFDPGYSVRREIKLIAGVSFS